MKIDYSKSIVLIKEEEDKIISQIKNNYNDYETWFDTLKKIGYRGWIVYEMCEVLDGGGFLQLGHDGGRAADLAAEFFHVLRALHKGERHPVDAEFQAEGEIG